MFLFFLVLFVKRTSYNKPPASLGKGASAQSLLTVGVAMAQVIGTDLDDGLNAAVAMMSGPAKEQLQMMVAEWVRALPPLAGGLLREIASPNFRAS
jgi:hypothetical protein